MKKVVRLTENDLARIVKRIIKENKDENMIHIPKEFHVLRIELGTKATPEDIISMYNDEVEEGVPLVSYSEDGFFTNEDGEEIEEFIILDELNYAIVGEEGFDYEGEEDDDDMPPYKTKWRMPNDFT